jgi:hypothetical protein
MDVTAIVVPEVAVSNRLGEEGEKIITYEDGHETTP